MQPLDLSITLSYKESHIGLIGHQVRGRRIAIILLFEHPVAGSQKRKGQYGRHQCDKYLFHNAVI